MKNLARLYKQIEGKAMTFDEYRTHTQEAIFQQGVYKLESCDDHTGWVLRSEDGTIHTWFMYRTENGSLYHVEELNTWYPNQCHLALNELALEMRIRSVDLIERGGARK